MVPPQLNDLEVRKQLIDYYKWVVSLATFVLTMSSALVSIFSKNVSYKWLLLSGWTLLGICIFMCWLLIKRLITTGIVLATPETEQSTLHKLFSATSSNVRRYGAIQNSCFLIGILLVVITFALNIL